MEGDPALVIRLVDAGSMLHQESHHVDIVIYACLRQGRKRIRPQLLDCVELSALGYMHTCMLHLSWKGHYTPDWLPCALLGDFGS